MNARLAAGRLENRQVITDSERLAAVYRESARQGSDVAFQREFADSTFLWLSNARAQYAADPLVAQSLMRTYGILGDVFARDPVAYRPWAVSAFSGANRIARGLVLDRQTGERYESDLTRYGLAWASALYLNQWIPQTHPGYSGETAPPRRRVDIAPLPVPVVDQSKWTERDKELWEEVRPRFVSSSQRVFQARVALDDLAARLEQQNLRVNQVDAAAALIMQGFLEDAAALIQAGQLQQALEALTRADYQRGKLKNVIGAP
jgi:hypothetical protein